MSQITIARKFAIVCSFLVIIVGSISTFAGYVIHKHSVIRDHDTHVEEYFNHFVQALSLPLWEMEYDSVKEICKLFHDSTPWVVSLTLTDSEGNMLCSRSREGLSVSIVRTQDVVYEKTLVGKVKAEFTNDLIFEHILKAWAFHIVVIVVIFLVLLGTIAWLTWKTVVIPTKHFTEYIKRIASGDYEFSIPTEASYFEFSIVISETLKMAEEIKKRENLLQREIEKREEVLRVLEESEAKFRAVMSVAGDGVIIVRSDASIEYSNRAAEFLFGYSREEFRKLMLCDLFSEPDRELIKKYVLKREELGCSVCEMTAVRKDGSTMPVEVSLANTFEESIPVELVVVIVRDISWRKESEREKKEALEKMYRLQKFEAIGTLASGIAHDFNNILTVIMGYVDLASLASPEDAPVQEYFSQIRSACSRARDLIQQIFAIGRSQPSSELIVFDIRPLVKETVKFLRASIPSTIRIEYKIDEEEMLIKADPSQIQQVLINLCTNSVHAMESMEEGILRIEVKQVNFETPNDCFFSTLHAGKYIQLRVTDTGCGIPSEIIHKIFDPYFTTKEPGKGTGLGLSIVRNVVLSCGGDIEVISEIGKGTSMIIYFPFAHKEKFAIDYAEEGEITVKDGKGKCILFVDDEKSIVELARLALISAGYRVYAFSDPREALEHFKNYHNDIQLVVTDVTMPYIRGDALAKVISSLRPDIPIILCTGYSFEFSPEFKKALGVREVLYKPFSGKKLIEAVEKVLLVKS